MFLKNQIYISLNFTNNISLQYCAKEPKYLKLRHVQLNSILQIKNSLLQTLQALNHPSHFFSTITLTIKIHTRDPDNQTFNVIAPNNSPLIIH